MDLYVAETLFSGKDADFTSAAIRTYGFTNVSLHWSVTGGSLAALDLQGSLDGSTHWANVPVLGYDGVTIYELAAPQLFHLIPMGVGYLRGALVVTDGVWTLKAGKWTQRKGTSMDLYVTETLQNAATATGNGTAINVRGFKGVTLQLVDTGSPNGTITWEGSVDAGATWGTVGLTDASGTTAGTATTAGMYHLPASHGLDELRARISAYNSGAFTVKSGKMPR